MTKITRYKQSLYQDWKDGEITQQEYREMKADYERQAAVLSDLLARLNAERAELLNGVDKEHPALVAFAKYQIHSGGGATFMTKGQGLGMWKGKEGGFCISVFLFSLFSKSVFSISLFNCIGFYDVG